MNNPVCFRARNIGVIRQVPTVVVLRNKMRYFLRKCQGVDRGVAHGSIGNWAVTQTGLAVYVFACGEFCLIEIISWCSKE
jgi:hypothetical protein